jgi:hypothetical protein
MSDIDATDDEPVQPLPGGTVAEADGAPVRLSSDVESIPLPGGEILDTSKDPVRLRSRELQLLMHELVRGALAFAFVILLAGVIVLAYTKIGTDSWDQAKEFMDVLVPALSALLGSATGFYFASRR